jgi:type IV pilus assembly protein PilB
LALRPEDVGDRVLYYGKGCEYCNNTGYRGRLGIYEIMVFNDRLREMVMRHASTGLLRNEAIKMGMRPLRESGLMGIYDGITTIEEVVKETIVEE